MNRRLLAFFAAGILPLLRCTSATPTAGCTSNADCAANAAGSLCNTSNGACVACLGDKDCLSPKSCDTARGVCVACKQDKDCPAGQVCAANACKPGCSASQPCPAGLVCDLVVGACVACLVDTDCGVGQVCRQKSCAAGCSASQPCAPGLVCDLSTLSCGECVTDGHCKGTTPRCNVATNRCVQCLPANDNCAPGTFCDTASLLCRTGCRGDDDCLAGSPSPASQGMPYCLTATHTCVACLASAQCATGSVCTSSQQCAPGCDSDARCSGGPVCCAGACQALGTAANCNLCGDACSAGQGCCARSCVSLTTVTNCGACGSACGPGRDCCGGSCVPVNTTADCGACGNGCGAGQGCCGARCASLASVANCGACGTVCGPGKDCCGGWCVDINTAANCGACGVVCTAGQPCTGGVCVSPTLPVGGARLWLKPEALAGLRDGDAVSRWTDASGNGHDAVQVSTNRQPVYRATVLNAYAAVQFDGLDDALGIKGTAVLNSISLFAVYRLTAGAPANAYYPVILGGDRNVTGEYYGYETLNGAGGNSPDVLDVFAGFSNDARAMATGISNFNEFKIISAVTAGFIHGTTVRVNGVNAVMSTTGANVALSVALGNATGTGWGGVGGAGNTAIAGAHQFKGDVLEVVVYGAALSEADRQAVERYLHAKYATPVTPPLRAVAPSAFVSPVRITFLEAPAGECNDVRTFYTPIQFASAQGFRDVNTGFGVDGQSGSSATCSACGNAVTWTAVLTAPKRRFGMYYAVGYGEASRLSFTDSGGNALGTLTVSNGQAFVGAESSTDIKIVQVTPTGTGHCIDAIQFE